MRIRHPSADDPAEGGSVEHSREAERARIARDLHDIVSHNVSVMVLQATAAERMLAVDPDRAADALLQVQSTGREAITELRRMVGLLRTDGEGAAREPMPGLSRVPALAEELRAAGQPVELQVEGAAGPLPPGVDLAAFRVVQEGLTNVRKHAGRAPVRVRIRYGADGVAVEVTDDGGTKVNGVNPGFGLVALRERVEFFGGRLEAGRREDDGGFQLTAELPAY